jgi:Family of unknown function (DUF5771)
MFGVSAYKRRIPPTPQQHALNQQFHWMMVGGAMGGVGETVSGDALDSSAILKQNEFSTLIPTPIISTAQASMETPVNPTNTNVQVASVMDVMDVPEPAPMPPPPRGRLPGELFLLAEKESRDEPSVTTPSVGKDEEKSSDKRELVAVVNNNIAQIRSFENSVMTYVRQIGRSWFTRGKKILFTEKGFKQRVMKESDLLKWRDYIATRAKQIVTLLKKQYPTKYTIFEDMGIVSVGKIQKLIENILTKPLETELVYLINKYHLEYATVEEKFYTHIERELAPLLRNCYGVRNTLTQRNHLFQMMSRLIDERLGTGYDDDDDDDEATEQKLAQRQEWKDAWQSQLAPNYSDSDYDDYDDDDDKKTFVNEKKRGGMTDSRLWSRIRDPSIPLSQIQHELQAQFLSNTLNEQAYIELCDVALHIKRTAGNADVASQTVSFAETKTFTDDQAKKPIQDKQPTAAMRKLHESLHCDSNEMVRKGYLRKDGHYVRPTCIRSVADSLWVPGETAKKKYQQQQQMGGKVKLPPLNPAFEKYGYHFKNESQAQRHKALERAVHEIGALHAFRAINELAIFYKNNKDQTYHKRIISDRDWIKSTFFNTSLWVSKPYPTKYRGGMVLDLKELAGYSNISKKRISERRQRLMTAVNKTGGQQNQDIYATLQYLQDQNPNLSSYYQRDAQWFANEYSLPIVSSSSASSASSASDIAAAGIHP